MGAGLVGASPEGGQQGAGCDIPVKGPERLAVNADRAEGGGTTPEGQDHVAVAAGINTAGVDVAVVTGTVAAAGHPDFVALRQMLAGVPVDAATLGGGEVGDFAGQVLHDAESPAPRGRGQCPGVNRGGRGDGGWQSRSLRLPR